MVETLDRTVGAFPLGGKIALVTGGGSGINLAFVKLARDSGAKVLIADKALSAEGKEYLHGAAGDVVFQECDVRDWADLKRLVPRAVEAFGDVPDVYVAGAGIFEPDWSHFWLDREDQGYAIAEVNFMHGIKLTRIALQSLVQKNRKGVVLFVGSMTAFVPQYSTPLYSATKSGLVGFVRAMGLADAAEGVKVVMICPGLVDTPSLDSRPDTTSQLPRDVLMAPIDVAEQMKVLIEDVKYPGGTLIELLEKGKTRVLPQFNMDPPSGDSVRSVMASTDINQLALGEMRKLRSSS